MITVRAPLRISFAGGGSDLPAFCEHEPGAVLGVALQSYMHIFVQHKFDGAVRLGYSRTENVAKCADLEHDIAREALASYCVRDSVEIVSVGDVPAGTGLGSSSAYAVALVTALHTYTHAGQECGPLEAARRACHVELERCGHAGGRQDQYLSAFGGLRYLTFHGTEVRVYPVKCHAVTLGALRDRLMLMYLGQSRDASVILRAQQDDMTPPQRANLRAMAAIATQMRDALEVGDLAQFGAMLHDAWMLKREAGRGITSPLVDELYARALAAGAEGGKLCGAGGAGFLLLYAEPEHQARVRAVLGLRELPVRFDLTGVEVWGDRMTVD
jgi:D-glycero-alpha-D-manno-heptose-7-phosphate kinase